MDACGDALVAGMLLAVGRRLASGIKGRELKDGVNAQFTELAVCESAFGWDSIGLGDLPWFGSRNYYLYATGARE